MMFRQAGVLGILVALQVGCVSGPVIKTYSQKTDAVAPATDTRVVSFAALMQQRVTSNSVYSEPKERDLMKRVLLGPNLVFESSRSSLSEPGTVGPAGATPGTPDLKDALGTPIQISLSSVMMNYLSSKGSVMLAPAVTRRFTTEWWCSAAGCPQTTWLERLIMLYQPKAPASKESAGAPSVRDLKIDDLPTSAFAVRRLGIYVQRQAVTVVQNAQLEIEFRPRRDGADASLCQSDLVVDVPSIFFSAELVSMRDGRILARIDEERSPKITMETRRTVVATQYTPVQETAFTIYRDNEPYDGKYTYTKEWTPQNTLCASAMAAYQSVSQDMMRKLDSQLQPTVTELFKATLDQLYER